MTNYLLPQPFPPFPPHSQERGVEKLSPWEMLSRGRTLGKRIGIGLSDAGLGQTELTSSLNMFEISAPSDDAAMPLTITLTPPKIRAFSANGELPNITGTNDNRQSTLSGAWFNPFAILEWGTGGVSCRAEIDIHNGAKVCLSASFVRISAALDNPPEDQGGKDYELAAFISPGLDKGLGGQRTITNPVSMDPASGALIPSAGPFIPVPSFARRVRVAGVVNGTPGGFAGYIIFYRDRQGTQPVCEYEFSEDTADSFFVPAGAYYFAFITGAANINCMQAIFDLAI